MRSLVIEPIHVNLKSLDQMIWSIPLVTRRFVDMGDQANTSTVIENVSRELDGHSAMFSRIGLLRFKDELIDEVCVYIDAFSLEQ